MGLRVRLEPHSKLGNESRTVCCFSGMPLGPFWGIGLPQLRTPDFNPLGSTVWDCQARPIEWVHFFGINPVSVKLKFEDMAKRAILKRPISLELHCNPNPLGEEYFEPLGKWARNPKGLELKGACKGI